MEALYTLDEDLAALGARADPTIAKANASMFHDLRDACSAPEPPVRQFAATMLARHSSGFPAAMREALMSAALQLCTDPLFQVRGPAITSLPSVALSYDVAAHANDPGPRADGGLRAAVSACVNVMDERLESKNRQERNAGEKNIGARHANTAVSILLEASLTQVSQGSQVSQVSH